MELTPVEQHDGLWIKREDLYRSEVSGVNGAKYRACQHLMERAAVNGASRVVSAASVLSPQSAIGATCADELLLPFHVIVGGTTPDKAVRHKSIAIAKELGATIEAIPVGYNPALQKASLAASQEPGVWRLPYGITTPPDASPEEIEDFLRVGGEQTANLPDEITTLILPFGTGNTAAGVLYGLFDSRPKNLDHVMLVGIGPDRLKWVTERLASVGRPLDLLVQEGVEIDHTPLHPWFATYGDVMRETLHGIVLHPTYEGKVVRFLNQAAPACWTRRDGTTCLWIVGGPI